MGRTLKRRELVHTATAGKRRGRTLDRNSKRTTIDVRVHKSDYSGQRMKKICKGKVYPYYPLQCIRVYPLQRIDEPSGLLQTSLGADDQRRRVYV